ncbi:unnamed protein product [Amaranthus hypochondriacus]
MASLKNTQEHSFILSLKNTHSSSNPDLGFFSSLLKNGVPQEHSRTLIHPLPQELDDVSGLILWKNCVPQAHSFIQAYHVSFWFDFLHFFLRMFCFLCFIDSFVRFCDLAVLDF